MGRYGFAFQMGNGNGWFVHSVRGDNYVRKFVLWIPTNEEQATKTRIMFFASLTGYLAAGAVECCGLCM